MNLLGSVGLATVTAAQLPQARITEWPFLFLIFSCLSFTCVPKRISGAWASVFTSSWPVTYLPCSSKSMVALMWHQVMCKQPGMSVSEMGSTDWTTDRESPVGQLLLAHPCLKGALWPAARVVWSLEVKDTADYHGMVAVAILQRFWNPEAIIVLKPRWFGVLGWVST